MFVVRAESVISPSYISLKFAIIMCAVGIDLQWRMWCILGNAHVKLWMFSSKFAWFWFIVILTVFLRSCECFWMEKKSFWLLEAYGRWVWLVYHKQMWSGESCMQIEYIFTVVFLWIFFIFYIAHRFFYPSLLAVPSAIPFWVLYLSHFSPLFFCELVRKDCM